MSELKDSKNYSQSEQLRILNESFALTADLLRTRQLRWRDFPLAKRCGQSDSYGIAEYLAAKKNSPIKFPLFAKKSFKECFREFKSEKKPALAFSKPLRPGVDLVIKYEKTSVSFTDKTFHVLIGLKFGEDIHLQDIASCLDQYEQLGMRWEYNSESELLELLNETHRLILLVVPVFESAATQLLNDAFDRDIFPAINFGAISFHEACAVAQGHLRKTCFNYSFLLSASIGLPYFHHSFKFQMIKNVSASEPGRLLMGQAWLLQYADIEAGRFIEICIPYSGRIRFMQRHAVPTINVNHIPGRRNLLTNIVSSMDPSELIMCDFNSAPTSAVCTDVELMQCVDSPEIMQKANQAGGSEFVNNCDDCLLKLRFENPHFSIPRAATWNVKFIDVSKSPRKSLNIELTTTSPAVVLSSTSS
jgi:hypothetical protein